MIATSAQRVSAQTTQASKDRIRHQTQINLAYFAAHPDRIDRRLAELDEEWDIERVLETGSSTLTLTGLVLSVLRGRKWLLLSFTVQGFFMQHALQGWCPPLPLFRRLGVRTSFEIEEERRALKALRGDFRDVTDGDPEHAADRALEASRR
jgi:hypothetical protein